MRLHKTGHPIADTISDLIGDLPDENYNIAYGILRHSLFKHDAVWFELDKGYWGAKHFDGSYRLSYHGTQARWDENAPRKPHGLTLEPWKRFHGDCTLICPPTRDVTDFFKINYAAWLSDAVRKVGRTYIIRQKGEPSPIPWHEISKVITFNSTVGIEALRRGIPVISDPIHSTIGSYTANKTMEIDGYDREDLFLFMSGHQFKLDEKEHICRLIQHYL